MSQNAVNDVYIHPMKIKLKIRLNPQLFRGLINVTVTLRERCSELVWVAAFSTNQERRGTGGI